MAALWFIIILVIAIVLAFKNGPTFALCFFGTTAIPCVAVAGAKWGLVAGDAQQKIGVPVIALILLAFAFWLSTYVSVTAFGIEISGLVLMAIGGVIGLAGVPLAWGGQAPQRN